MQDTTLGDGIDGIDGKTKWCTSKRRYPETLGEYFDNNIYPLYSPDTLIDLPILISFYANEIPAEIKEIANA